MYCLHCGFEVNEGQKYCLNCGNEIANNVTEVAEPDDLSAVGNTFGHEQKDAIPQDILQAELPDGVTSQPQTTSTGDGRSWGKKPGDRAVRIFVTVLVVILVGSLRMCIRSSTYGSGTSSQSATTVSLSKSSSTSTKASSDESPNVTWDSEGPYFKGSIEGNVYYNLSCNMMFTLPEGWHYCSQEEIDQMNGEPESEADPLSISYETQMRAENMDGTQVFSWDVGKSDSSRQGFQSFRESELNRHRQKFSEDEYSGADVDVESNVISVAGEDAPGLRSVITYSGVSLYEEQVVWLQNGTAVNMNAMCVGDDNLDAVFASVAPLTMKKRIELLENGKSATSSESVES